MTFVFRQAGPGQARRHRTAGSAHSRAVAAVADDDSPALDTQQLLAIERDVDREPVQQLRSIARRIAAELATLDADTADHAYALLLKINWLIESQAVSAVDGRSFAGVAGNVVIPTLAPA